MTFNLSEGDIDQLYDLIGCKLWRAIPEAFTGKKHKDLNLSQVVDVMCRVYNCPELSVAWNGDDYAGATDKYAEMALIANQVLEEK